MGIFTAQSSLYLQELETRRLFAAAVVAAPTPAPKPAPVHALSVHLYTAKVLDGTKTAIDFGTIDFGDAVPTETFKVTNTGNVALKLGHVTAPAGFDVVSDLPAQIKAKKSATFVVALDGAARGILAGDVAFSTNVPGHKVFNFAIGGRVLVAHVLVSHSGKTLVNDSASYVRFGKVTARSAKPMAFEVTNTGDAPLDLRGLVVPEGFVVGNGLLGSLGPGASDVLVIRLNVHALGTHVGDAMFITNDPDAQSFALPIKGKMVGIAASTDPGNSSILNITGTDEQDRILLIGDSSEMTVIGNRKFLGKYSSIQKVNIDTQGGDDIVDTSGCSVDTAVFTGAGNDFVSTGRGNDELHGGNGNDTLIGGQGVDAMFGEDGDDTVNAVDGAPDHVVNGGAGNNRVLEDPTDPRG